MQLENVKQKIWAIDAGTESGHSLFEAARNA
jgi:hypothetical protein